MADQEIKNAGSSSSNPGEEYPNPDSGSSSSNPGEEYPYPYPYPYPSGVCVPNIVTVKLSGRDMYDVWETQMLCLLESHDMLCFVNSDPPAEKVGEWRRSDALLKGWILGSLSDQTLNYIIKSIPKEDLTSQNVWHKLKTFYGPIPRPATPAAEYEPEGAERIRSEENKSQIDSREKLKAWLYHAIMMQDFNYVERILSKKIVTLSDKITINGNTALHVAVGTSKDMDFLEMLLNHDAAAPALDMRNSDGSTVLHVAAIVGNTEAAELLVQRKPELLYTKDAEGQTPVARALSNMHTDTYLYLSERCFGTGDLETGYLAECCFGTGDIETGSLVGDISGLLVNLISSHDYRSAFDLLLESKRELTGDGIKTVLMALAQNFPRSADRFLRYNHRKLPGDPIEYVLMAVEQNFPGDTWKNFEPLSRGKILDNKDKFHAASFLLFILCYSIRSETEVRLHHEYYNNAILEATRQNADKMVHQIVKFFPDAIWSANEEGHNIIQYAVINRSEKVYSLLYQMSEHKNIYRTIQDPFGNNLLHLAARLAPPEKLNHISGAALQIQRELQWFKEVQGFVCPLNIMQKISFGETPEMVFTREHKELVKDGEKWMKETAQSYTITAALITTIVFAAAITVPGGNKQDNGIPMFTSKAAFTIFAVSDAVSLFTSVTSLLMFLSILTARYSDLDFLLKLPTKLIIGLATLFISTTAMIVAFGATLFLVFGQNNSLILLPIAALTCLPITSFMTLQFPLIYDLMSATYGRSIFCKESTGDLFY